MEKITSPFLEGSNFIQRDEGKHVLDIKTVVDNPDLLIKEVGFFRSEMNTSNRELLANQLAGQKKLLIEYVGDYLPGFDYIIGHESTGEFPNQPSLYVVIKKIQPESLTPETIEDYAKQIDELIDKSGTMYFYTLNNNHELDTDHMGQFPDIELRNLIWGKEKDDANAKLYLVDTFPIIERFPYELSDELQKFLKDLIKLNIQYTFPKTLSLIKKLEARSEYYLS